MPATLAALLDSADPDAPALLWGEDGTRSFGELRERSERLAGGLLARGVRPGDRVALWLPNVPAWVELQLALARIGAIAVAVNTRFRAHEVDDVLTRSGARLLVYAPGFRGIDFAGILAEAGTRVETLALGDPAADALVKHPPVDTPAPDPDAPCTVFTSSGTTGRPKLVAHSQRAIATHSAGVAGGFGYRAPGAVVLAMLPVCGVFGFNTLLGALAAGAPAALLDAFDADAAAALAARTGTTHTTGTDEMVRRLLEAGPPATLREAGFAAFDGDPRALVDLADAHGVRAFMSYGSSEVQALLAHPPADAEPELRAVAGWRPVTPGTEVRARDENGQPCPPGEAGELEIRGPTVTIGYLGGDDGSELTVPDALTPDGFLRTGDLGTVAEDGTFAFQSRRGDALRLGGFLVSRAEIAAFLEGLPGVRDAQVVGAEADGRMRAVAFVVAGNDFDETAALEACAGALARYKVPRRIVALDGFPVTEGANGEKVRRDVLRERAAELLADAGG